MNILILGAGASGRAAAELARRENAAVQILDGDRPLPEGAWDLAVVSPGIPLTHPWQVGCRARGVPVISELSFAARYWRGPVLAVTGSKGKSSVVKLVADTLNLAGYRAVPCGNYGTPFCRVVLDTQSAGLRAEETWAVVEVSSFQMETTPRFDCAAAAVLNLQEDHLDRHGSVAVYHALKRRLLDAARVKILPPSLAKEPVSDGVDTLRRLPGFKGSYFDNPILEENAWCAVRLLRAAGLDAASVSAGFAAFVPLPHRMQPVVTHDDVCYIDDSKATSLAALAAGVRMASAGGRKIRLIAGGLAKGDDPKSVIPYLSVTVKKVYLIGDCANQFFEAWRETVPCEICGTLDRAVEEVRRDVGSGETVLLSPGTASFDQFKSYGARGDQFASLVRAGAE